MLPKFDRTVALLGGLLVGRSPAYAQQAVPANPLAAVPMKMPFDVPYGAATRRS